MSTLYKSVALDVVRHSHGQRDGIEAAHIALSMAPWRAASHLSLAQSLSARSEVDAAIDHARRAARASPADGYVWAYLARLIGSRQRSADEQLELYRMALKRSPNAAALHRAIALDGVLRWRTGDDELRALWRGSMQYSLRDDRRAFLHQVVKLNRDPYWCAANQDHLPIRKWCAQARFARNSCRTPNLPPKAAAWCAETGLTPTGP